MNRISNGFCNCILALAGIMLTLAFAPYHHYGLAVPALGLLFFSWIDVTPALAALRGLFFGFGLFGSGASWFYFSIRDFSAAGIVPATVITALIVLILASFPSLAGYFCGKFLRRGKAVSIALGFPSVWTGSEYLRGAVFLNGFPWLQIGYSQDPGPLSGYIPVIGIYGTGFITALTAVVLALAISRKRYQPRYYVLIVGMLWSGGLALKTIAWTHPIGAAIKVTLLQGNLAQKNKWLPENRDRTLRMYREMTRQHWDSQLIVWPETAVPAYYDEINTTFIDPLLQEVRQHRTALLAPLPIREQSNDKRYNAAMLLAENIGIYRKVHLVPFGEYMPLPTISGPIVAALNAHIGRFLPGSSQQPLLKAAGYAFATSICYEDAFSAESLRAMPDAAFLVNVTNDSWFGDYLQPQQHLQMARMRALETGRYLVRATNTGLTAVVNADGTLLAQAPQSVRYALTATIVPMGGTTPYAKTGDGYILWLMALLFLLSAWHARRLKQTVPIG